MTNADKIRSKTDEEIGEIICDTHAECYYCVFDGHGVCDCKLLDWLKQEVDADV